MLKTFEATTDSSKNIKEQILTNPSFLRFAGGFEVYQKLINSAETSNRNDIITRMKNLHFMKSQNDLDSDQTRTNNELNEMINKILDECEQNNFTKDSLAQKIKSSSMSDNFIEEWNRQENEVEEESNMIHVNNVIAYKQDEKNISLHIRPTGIREVELLRKIIDGFKVLADKLSNNEIDTNSIIMKSWLLGERFEKKVNKIFGDNIVIQNLESDDEDFLAVQHYALLYNNKFLKNYLRTGHKPEARKIVMTKHEFISKFRKP